jgi:hypothetical protein
MDLKKMSQIYGFLFGEKAIKSRQYRIMLPFIFIKRSLLKWKKKKLDMSGPTILSSTKK